MTDLYTSTLDGAAAFERGRAAEHYDPSDFREMSRAEAEAEQAETFFDSLSAMPVRPGPGRQPKETAA